MMKTQELIGSIENGAYDAAFRALYCADEAGVARQRARYAAAVRRFETLYGADREVELYSAPGRTEIGGNHTDHNNGVVMAAAVNLDIIAVVSRNDSTIVRVKSHGFRDADVVDVSDDKVNEREFGRSSALIRGVAARIRQLGGQVAGFDAYTTSDVPVSYTHLDVYKRQGRPSPAEKRCVPACGGPFSALCADNCRWCRCGAPDIGPAKGRRRSGGRRWAGRPWRPIP